MLGIAVVLATLPVCERLSAGDWPQLLGPARNGVAVGEKLHAAWPTGGPRVVWEASVGGGFAGVAVAGGRVLSFTREGSSEVVRSYAAADGVLQWEAKSECRYQGGVSSDKGPRCVPLIAGDRVYVLGVEGRLRCLELGSGREVWQRDTERDYRPLEGYFGVGSTPVLQGDRLIVNVGGREDSSIVAFDAKTGKTVWQVFTDAASYSAPVVVRSGQRSLAIVVTRLHLTGVDIATGELAFSFPFGARGPTVNGASPVLLGERVFVSSSYNIGSLLVQLTADGAREVWRDEELLATQYATAIPAGSDHPSVVFAMDGRQDAGSGSGTLKCLDLESRRVLWERAGFDYGTLLRAGGDLLVLTCGGELVRVSAAVGGYREVARAKVLRATDSGYRLPALAGGRLFVRDDDTLKCLDVGSATGGE
jgi:outer membrane protein assembly factor BamB